MGYFQFLDSVVIVLETYQDE